MKKYLIIIFALIALSGYGQQDLKARYMNVTRMLYSGTDSLISPADTLHQFNYMKMKDPVLSLDGVNKRSMERFVGDTAKLLHWSDTIPTTGARIATGDDIKNMIDGSGTASFIPKFSDANTLTNSVFKDDGTIATLEQNSVQPFTSVASGAVDNTLYLKEGKVGIGVVPTSANLELYGGGFTQLVVTSSESTKSGGIYISNNVPNTLCMEVTGSGQSGNPSAGIIYTRNSLSKIQLGSARGTPQFTLLTSSGFAGFLTTAPSKTVEINSATGANLRLTYNDADGSAPYYVDYGVTSSGDATITPSGGDVVISGRITTTQITAALTDNTPTDAEIDAATSLTPSTAGAGWQCTIKDNNGTGLLYKVESDGTDWYYVALTKAL